MTCTCPATSQDPKCRVHSTFADPAVARAEAWERLAHKFEEDEQRALRRVDELETAMRSIRDDITLDIKARNIAGYWLDPSCTPGIRVSGESA